MSWKVVMVANKEKKQKQQKNSTQIQTCLYTYIIIIKHACSVWVWERVYHFHKHSRGSETQCVAKQTETACGLMKKIMRKKENNNNNHDETTDMHIECIYSIILNAIFMCRKHACIARHVIFSASLKTKLLNLLSWKFHWNSTWNHMWYDWGFSVSIEKKKQKSNLN